MLHDFSSVLSAVLLLYFGYTTFEYSVLRLSHSIVREGEDVQVTVTVTNTGAVSGKETVQFYVTPPKSERHRPVRELKGFANVFLQPGESKDVQFTLDKRSLAYYEPELHDFYAESGTYQICIGASSRDLRLTGSLEWQAAQPLPVHFTAASTLKQVMTHPVGAAIIGPILQRMASAAGGATWYFSLWETYLENFMSRPDVIPTFRQRRCKTGTGTSFGANGDLIT